MLFEIIVFDKSGVKRKISVNADKEESAKNDLISRGYKVISIKKKSTFLNFEEGLTIKQRSDLFNTLATLVVSVPLIDALDIIADNFGGTIRKVSNELKEFIRRGIELDAAIEQMGEPHFSSTVVAMLRAGVQTGTLSQALKDTAEFELSMYRLEKESSKGVAFQITMFFVSAILILGTQYGFVPYVLEEYVLNIFEGVDVKWIDTISNWTTYSMIIVLFFSFILFFINRIMKPLNPIFADKIIESIPFYSKLILAKKRFIYLYQLSKLIGKGVPVDISFIKTIDNMEKGKLKDDFERSLKKMYEGADWVKELTSFSDIDRAALRSSTDKEKISEVFDELALNNKRQYKDIREIYAQLVYWVAMFYLVMAAVIIFLYTTMPMLEGINKL